LTKSQTKLSWLLFTAPGVVVIALDLQLDGCEFDSQPAFIEWIEEFSQLLWLWWQHHKHYHSYYYYYYYYYYYKFNTATSHWRSV